MVYLLVNHVPFGAGSAPGKYHVGDLFLQDLRAQASAIREVGGKLVVATPCVPHLDAMAGGSFNTVEMIPSECGFTYAPLPRYLSMKEFLKVRGTLRKALMQLITSADIVQMDYGGHPVMLGQVVWPIATRLGKKRIFIFDGADPFPRLELEAASETNSIKRLAKKIAVRRQMAFCRDAVARADLVFSHNAAVVERFRSVWNERCHLFDRSFVTEDVLIDDAELERRKQQLLDESRPLELIMAGRQIQIKGTGQVIQAVARLRDQNVAARLNIMGDGEDLPAFKKLAHDLNLSEFIRFTGTVPYGQPLWDQWAKADVMIVANLTAEISRNILLSLARGLPLVTYENPGTDSLLADGAAVIVSRGDVAALAEAIANLSRNRRQMIDLASKGLSLAKTNTLAATHRRRAELAANLLSPLPLGEG